MLIVNDIPETFNGEMDGLGVWVYYLDPPLKSLAENGLKIEIFDQLLQGPFLLHSRRRAVPFMRASATSYTDPVVCRSGRSNQNSNNKAYKGRDCSRAQEEEQREEKEEETEKY